jgi:hypothetical protein
MNNETTTATAAAATGFWRRHRAWLTALALSAAAFVMYRDCAGYDVLGYDDRRILVNHPGLYHQPTLAASIRAIVFEHYPREEPLLVRDITWAIDSRLFGFDNPAGFHLGNVVLHAMVMAAFFLFVLQVTRRYAAALAAALAALTLAVHVEPVAWIMGRKDLLVSLFAFPAMMCLAALPAARGRVRRAGLYTASLCLHLLALFSKISAVVFPLVYALLLALLPHLSGQAGAADRLHGRRAGRALALVLPHLALSMLVYRWYGGVLKAFGLFERGYSATPLQHLRNLALINPLVFWRYLANLYLPRHLSLFANWPALDSTYGVRHVAVATATIAALVLGAVLLWRRRKDLLFFFLAFFVCMIPYLNLVYIGIWVANRYLYFSAFFLLAGLAAAAVPLLERRGARLPARLAAGALLAVGVAANLHCRADYLPRWRNDITLWTYEMALPDPSPDAFLNLASHYYTRGAAAGDGEERDACFAAASRIVTDALSRFRQPARRARLLFLEALMAIVRRAPAAERLAALQAVEKLDPQFDAVLWQLTVFYYKQALQQEDRAEKERLGRMALDAYRRYRRRTPRGTAFKARDASIRREFASDMPFLQPELDALP